MFAAERYGTDVSNNEGALVLLIGADRLICFNVLVTWDSEFVYKTVVGWGGFVILANLLWGTLRALLRVFFNIVGQGGSAGWRVTFLVWSVLFLWLGGFVPA